jgi:hypothetical protein
MRWGTSSRGGGWVGKEVIETEEEELVKDGGLLIGELGISLVSVIKRLTVSPIVVVKVEVIVGQDVFTDGYGEGLW